ncbi:MAG: HAD family hydrolase [Rhodospirillales bacterium]|nr:HAD family hydrolase [Rhodospirillales bacterium]
MNQRKNRADLIIFDCDGVLVDSEPLSSRLMAEALTREGYPVTPQDCIDRYTGISLGSLIAKVEADWGRKLPGDFEEKVRANDLEAFARELEPIPGVADMLEVLTVPVCVASSGAPQKIENSLRITGLDRFFGANVFSAHMVENGKPAPDLFLLAAERMGVAPGDCAVIEDSEAGIKAALAAGMPVLGFAGGGHAGPGYADMLRRAGAGIVFETMRDLPGLI